MEATDASIYVVSLNIGASRVSSLLRLPSSPGNSSHWTIVLSNPAAYRYRFCLLVRRLTISRSFSSPKHYPSSVELNTHLRHFWYQPRRQRRPGVNLKSWERLHLFFIQLYHPSSHHHISTTFSCGSKSSIISSNDDDSSNGTMGTIKCWKMMNFERWNRIPWKW